MPKPIRMAVCHPDRKHKAKGLCNPCYREQDKPARRAASKKWYGLGGNKRKQSAYKADPMKVYWWTIKRLYNLSPERYQELYEAGCWLCGEPFQQEKLRPPIDHDHRCCPGIKSCGKCVRGIAHHFCNLTIALENPSLLRKIADSLERYLGR